MKDLNVANTIQSAAMHSALDVAYAAKEERPHPAQDLIDHVEQLLRTSRRVELLMNSDGTIDVRCDGIATYGRGLYAALRSRVDIETARVTDRVMGEQANMAGAANKTVNKIRP